jgi:hypothetical protein
MAPQRRRSGITVGGRVLFAALFLLPIFHQSHRGGAAAQPGPATPTEKQGLRVEISEVDWEKPPSPPSSQPEITPMRPVLKLNLSNISSEEEKLTIKALFISEAESKIIGDQEITAQLPRGESKTLALSGANSLNIDTNAGAKYPKLRIKLYINGALFKDFVFMK